MAVPKLVLDDDVQGMNDPGDEAEQRQQNVQPEMASEAYFQKHADRRQENGKQDLDCIACGDGHVLFIRMTWADSQQIVAHSRSCPCGIAGGGARMTGGHALAHRRPDPAVLQGTARSKTRSRTVNRVIYIVGAVVIVLVILGFFGLR